MTFPMTEDVQLTRFRSGRKPRNYYCRKVVVTNGGHVTTCNRFLFRAVLLPGCYLEVRCPKCRQLGVYHDEDGILDV